MRNLKVFENENKYNIQEAIDYVVENNGVNVDDIDASYTFVLNKNGFSVGVVRVRDKNRDLKCFIYSFDNKKLVYDKPFKWIRTIKDDKFSDYYVIVEQFERGNGGLYNILTKNGLMFKDFVYSIESLKNGDFIVETSDGYTIVNVVNGNTKVGVFDEAKLLEDDNLIYLRGDDGYFGKIVDKSFNIVLDDVILLSEITINWVEGEDTVKESYVYHVKHKINQYREIEEIYDSSLNLVVENVYDVNVSDKYSSRIGSYINVCYVDTENGYNIIGKNGKLLFDKCVKNIDEDFAEGDNNCVNVAETFDGKYYLLFLDYLEIFGNETFDDLVYVGNNFFGFDSVIALRKNKKCNFICADPDADEKYMDYLLDEPVNNVYEVGLCNELFLARKGLKLYLIWKNGRLIELDNPDSVHDTDIFFDSKNHIVYVENGGYFDILQEGDDETFCEKYFGDSFMIDSIMDEKSDCPIIKKDGKYTYVNLEMFRPAMYNNGTITWFDSAEPAIYDESLDERIFNVVYKGEHRQFIQ